MRRLMWFAVGFSAAAALCAYVLSGIIAVYIALFACMACVGFAFFKRRTAALIAVVLLGFSAGMLYCCLYEGIVLSAAKEYDGKSHWAKIEATDYSFSTDYGSCVDGKAELSGRTYRIRLYTDGSESIKPGDILSGRVRLRYTSKNGLETATYHKGEGIFLLAYAEGQLQLTRAEKLPAKYIAAWLRKSIAERLTAVFPKDTAFFAKALLLGDDSQITFSDNLAFQKSGIRHVVAVSGLHVSILFSLVYFATGRQKRLTLFAGLPVLFLFAAVAGFTPSIVRACIMQSLLILSVAIDREYDPATALSFAVLAILIANPLTVTSAGFQLSVGCMVGIFGFSTKIQQYLRHEKRFGPGRGKSLSARLNRWFVGSVSVSVSAMLVTVPLCAVYFGMVSMVGILTNFLVLWLLSFLFCGIIAAGLLSVLWMPGAALVAGIVSVPMRFVLGVSRTVAELPFAVAYTDSPYTVLWLVLSYCLLLLFFLCKRRSPALLSAGIVIVYFLSLLLTWVEPYTDNFRLTVVDVGQGQCILLQSKESAYLIDCGGDDPERTADAALQAMGASGITKLDGLILTHYDSDHANGTVHLLQAMDVAQLYLPDTDPENKLRRQLIQQDLPVLLVKDNLTLPCGTANLILYPSKTQSQGNESSMCILFRSENCDILITGDRDHAGEQQLLQQMLPDIEILVAGHHGAATSNSMALLHHTMPELVLISVGADNLHGHPDSNTLKRLYQAGCTVRRTDLEGTIMIRG